MNRKIRDSIVELVRQRLLMLFVTVATIALSVWLLLPDTRVARNNDIDEGVYLMVARLLHRGCDPRAFFFDQFWFFPKILATAFRLFGDSLMVGRLTAFAFALAGVAGIAALSYQLGVGWTGATAAGFICALSPLYIRQSRIVMADVPATACVVWALVFVFLFQKNRQRLWLALSGICASASLMLKPFTIGFVVSIIFILIAQRTRRENGRLKLDAAILTDSLVFVGTAVLTAAPFVDFLHPIDEYHRTVGFHFAERNWLITRVDDRWRGLVGLAKLNIPILLFAIAGVIALRPLSRPLMALVVGELLTIAILFAMPPWLHHYVLILPPLIVIALLGFDRGFAQFRAWIGEYRNRTATRSSNKLIAMLFGCALLLSLIDLPWLFRLERRAIWPRLIEVDPVVHYLEQNFRLDEYLISDDAMVLYLADRLTPPSAINFTFADVLKFDPASFSRFEQINRENKVTGVIVTNRFNRNRRLMSWLEQNFELSARVGLEQNDELAAHIFSRKSELR